LPGNTDDELDTFDKGNDDLVWGPLLPVSPLSLLQCTDPAGSKPCESGDRLEAPAVNQGGEDLTTCHQGQGALAFILPIYRDFSTMG